MRTARATALFFSTVFVLVALAHQAAAFEARVVTTAGEPLVGARIQILGERGSVVADGDGRFVIEPQPTPPFVILVTRPDGVVLQPISVEAVPDGAILELQVKAVMTGSVTVLATIPDLELPPAAAYTLSGSGDLDQRNPGQLAAVLENIPGAGTVGTGPAAVPALRGMAHSRTLIILDDGRVTTERRAGPSATFLDPATVEEVEVVRGPGSVAYGSDAFGGLIRARTRIPGPGEPTTVRYSLLGGTVDGQRAADVEVGADVLGGGLLVAANARAFDNYHSPEGEVENSQYEGWGYRLGYQHEVPKGVLRLLWRTDHGRDIGKPATDSATRPTTYPEENSHRFGANYERPGPGSWSRLATSLTWSSYQLVTTKDRLPTPERPRDVAEADVFAYDYGLRVEAERPLGPTRMIAGIDLSGRYGLHATNRNTVFNADDSPANSSLEVSVDRARRDNAAAFVGLSGSLSPVALSGGLRLDWVTSKNSGGYFGDHSTSDSQPSGFVAATFPLHSDLDLTAQVSRGFRDALLSDRYYRGLTGRGAITGNPALNPETSLQFDVALRYSGGPLQLAAFAYRYRIDGLIERYEAEQDEFLFRNRGRAQVTGLELEATMQLGSNLLGQLAVQSQRGDVVDDDTPMDDIPPDGVILTLRRDPSQSWWWLARAAAFARDDRPGPTEKTTPGYATLDIGVGWRLSNSIRLQLLGRNLLDQSYFASADEAAVLAPGRGVQLSVRGTL